MTFRFTESDPITIPGKGITILVGANGSGKSLALREVQQLTQTNADCSRNKMLADFQIEWPDAAQIEALLKVGKPVLRGPADHLEFRDVLQRGGSPKRALHVPSILRFLQNRHGIFAVRCGELENSLPEYTIPGKKTDWAIAALERLGRAPSEDSYIPTGETDVWAFMRGILDWISQPDRKGTN